MQRPGAASRGGHAGGADTGPDWGWEVHAGGVRRWTAGLQVRRLGWGEIELNAGSRVEGGFDVVGGLPQARQERGEGLQRPLSSLEVWPDTIDWSLAQ